jgi:hypothetical protein
VAPSGEDRWYVTDTPAKFRGWHPAGFPCNCTGCVTSRPLTRVTLYYVNQVGDALGGESSAARLAGVRDFERRHGLSNLYTQPASQDHAAARDHWLQTLKQHLFTPWEPRSFGGIRPGQKPLATPDEMMEHVRQLCKGVGR